MWDEAKNIAALAHVAPQLSWPVFVAGEERRHPQGGTVRFRTVQRLGPLEPAELALWLGQAAIFALPARYEPFGLTVLEAGLAGCALLLGDIPSLREVWNGAATYYRGLLRALHARGHAITFYEPDAFERQQHRDIPAPVYARSVVYAAHDDTEVRAMLAEARDADVVVKASGVGVFDTLLEREVLALQGPHRRVIFWDVDAPATLDRIQQHPDDPFHQCIPEYDLILTYGGGSPVVQAYEALGARACVPIYNALDPTTHDPVEPEARFAGTLGFLGNRLPDRETRVYTFFFEPAQALPEHRFLLGGSGWEQHVPQLPTVTYLGHVYTRDHNAFNGTPLAVLNINRESMARYGFSPPTRVFEAAGAAACLSTDAWEGLELFLAPGHECLTARERDEVVKHLYALTPEQARLIGQAARQRILAEHTYARRAAQVETLLYATCHALQEMPS